jgi:hypothetical protein
MRESLPETRKVEPMSVAKNVNKMPLSGAAIAWLSSRGISEATALKAGLVSTKSWMQPVGKETESIMFPYTNKGQE